MGLFGRNRKVKQARQELAAHYEQLAADELARAGLDPELVRNAGTRDGMRALIAQTEELSAKVAADGIAAYQAAPAGGAPPPVAQPSGEDPLDALARLGELHRAGVITDEQFAAEKQRLLGS